MAALKSRARRGVAKQDILEAAFSLFSNEGEGGFSIRKVGAMLGVDPMTVLHHFRSRDDLVRAIADHAVHSVEVPVATSPPGAAVPPPASDPVPALGMSGVRLSMHLWNEDPARRFVVLNGQRMMEGERIGNITLVEILRDGVIVERDGQQARIDLP